MLEPCLIYCCIMYQLTFRFSLLCSLTPISFSTVTAGIYTGYLLEMDKKKISSCTCSELTVQLYRTGLEVNMGTTANDIMQNALPVYILYIHLKANGLCWAIQCCCLRDIRRVAGPIEWARKRKKERAQEQWEWEHGGKPTLLVSFFRNGGWKLWFGVSRCLPFLLFLSAPSSSFWLAIQRDLFRWFELEGERGRGIKEGLRAVGLGTWRKAFFLVFLLPPVPIVLRCSFLFLLAHYADDKCVLSVDHFCLMFSLFGMPQSTHSFVRMVGLLIGMFDSLACLAHE